MIFGYSPDKFRKDFPILNKKIIYLDNACMSLKPLQVINKMQEYYTEYSACAGRSSHRLALKVELEVDSARNEVRKFINARKQEEIIFTRNTSEGINLVANSIGLKKDDEIIISDKEHNSNLIPWLKLKDKIGIKVIIAKTNENGIDINDFKSKISSKTKVVSLVHTSNADGVSNPVREITLESHRNGAIVILDAAQAIPSIETDVKNLDVDFMAFSGHKMLGPTGTGVLYGKKEMLEKLDQYNVGGETVIDSFYDHYQIENLPNRFEAGLQDYSGIIGLGQACTYLKKIGMSNISKHEIFLNKTVTDLLSKNEKISILGPINPEKRSAIFSFNIKGINPHDISKMLDSSKSIMTRSGMHCVHSWFNSRKIEGSCRASFYLYNTEEEAKTFAEEIKKICRI